MSTLFLDAFSVDNEACENGRWLEIMKMGEEVIRIKLRRTTSKKFKEKKQILDREFEEKLAIATGTVQLDLYQDLLAQCIADAIIIDWEGVDLGDGPIPYTYENAYALLLEFPDFMDRVWNAATVRENFTIKDKERAKLILKKN